MPLRKATLRRMPPVTRKFARLVDELESVHRRLKNMIGEVQRLEHDSRALAHAKQGINPDEAIFILVREDVVECAKEMGIPEEAITDDVLRNVRKGVEAGLECWSDVVKDAISYALKS